MMKFKIGDKVRVKEVEMFDTALLKNGDVVEFRETMCSMIDREFILKDKSLNQKDGTWTICGFTFAEDWLEKVKQEKDIKIKYMFDDLEKLHLVENKSDWMDLRSASKEDIVLKAGEFKLIPLGIAMELPEGYEAHVVPRSSTFKNFGIIQTNHQAVIDESYCGDNDWWFYPVYALRDTVIKFNDRICHFRIIKKMPSINFSEVETLNNKDRGGHGSTGVK